MSDRTKLGGVIPIMHIKKWKCNEDIIEFCEHIRSHSNRYERERVFEAKTVLNNLMNKAPKQSQLKMEL